ncbi:MAG TPA: hypothetical protein VEX13_07670 [Chloroflexia bacterium]|nr:hypothetical protein [Chloroflexia bacterium]
MQTITTSTSQTIIRSSDVLIRRVVEGEELRACIELHNQVGEVVRAGHINLTTGDIVGAAPYTAIGLRVILSSVHLSIGDILRLMS